MDIADISKVANRKRMGEDVEKLREKVSRETSKIIKLKVAQDTAYWDLKEKLQGVEANHERLQANMVDVQMQHEAISSAYHRELRQRPETLNKLASTREIADALEEYTARVRGSLRRAQADIERVRGAYGEAGARAAHAAAAAHAAVRAHRAALADAAAAQHAAAQDQLERMARELTHRTELLATAHAETQHLREKLQICEREVEEGRARVAVLQRDMEESRRREDDGRRVHHELEIQIERLNGEKQALQIQLEQNAVEVRNSLAALQEEMRVQAEHAAAELEAEREHGRVATAQAHAEAEKLRADRARTEAALQEVTEARVQLETALQEKIEIQGKLEVALEEEKAALYEKGVQLARAELARDEQSSVRAGLEAELAEMRKRAEEMRAEHEAELSRRGDTVTALMRDVATEGEARARAEAALKARDAALKDKDAELTKQMDIILEVRAEKERLQEKICGMQATIDNIQKELSGPRKPSVSEPAVRDTDALKKSAVHETNTNKPPAQDFDAMLYTFLSDSSVDADQDRVPGKSEVQRRFEALSRDAARAMNRMRPPKPRGIGAASRVRPLPVADELRAATPTPAAAPRTFFKNKRQDKHN